jgi:hypothetical protein
MNKLGHKVIVKTYLGDIRQGVIKEFLTDGSMFVEIDEQIVPDLSTDLLIHDLKGRPFTIYKSKFPNWQAWVKPEWVVRNVTHEKQTATI